MIYRYEKDTTSRPTLDLFNESGEPASVNLCSVGEWCYVSVVDEAVHDPDVTLEEVTLTPELRAAIKSASPHCKLIKKRAWEKIAKEFPEEDQKALDRKMAAAGAGIVTLTDADKAVLTKYHQVNDEALAWAAEQYAALGL